MKLNQFLTKAFRRKVMGQGGTTTLARKLGVFDITALGVGSTLGAGYEATRPRQANTEAPRWPSLYTQYLCHHWNCRAQHG